MSEFIERRTRMGRRERARFEGVRAVLQGLTLRHTTEVIPAQSSHYRPSEEVTGQLELPMAAGPRSLDAQQLFERLNAPDSEA